MSSLGSTDSSTWHHKWPTKCINSFILYTILVQTNTSVISAQKTKCCPNANFVIPGSTAGCHNDSLQCHHWQQGWLYDNFLFSVNSMWQSWCLCLITSNGYETLLIWVHIWTLHPYVTSKYITLCCFKLIQMHDFGYQRGNSHLAHYTHLLWPGDAIWRHGTRSTLAQVMACCLTAPSHHLNQCWLIIGVVPRHPSQGIILRRCEDTNQWNKIENCSFIKMAPRFPRDQWVKWPHQQLKSTFNHW